MAKNNFVNIGILGGSFDPPHKGHIYISKKSIKLLKLEKVIWAITKKNPLKKTPFFSLTLRKKLCHKLINSHKKIQLSFYEDSSRCSYFAPGLRKENCMKNKVISTLRLQLSIRIKGNADHQNTYDITLLDDQYQPIPIQDETQLSSLDFGPKCVDMRLCLKTPLTSQ